MLKITYMLVLLTALAVFAKPSERLSLPKQLQGNEIPWFAFDVKDSNGTYGKTVNPENLKEIIKQKKYRKVVFYFFAPWCIICHESLKNLSDKADEFKKKNVLIVLVNTFERDLDNYSPKKTDEWLKQRKFFRDEWLLGFDKYSNSFEDLFDLPEKDWTIPKTLITDNNLRPLMLIGVEGDDFLQILLE